MQRRYYFILSCFLLLPIVGMAQDLHFSQYFASPLTLNPAMTGNFSGDFRVTGNYRNQWFGSVSNNAPFQTFSGSYDMTLFNKKLRKDQVGVGAVFFNDKAGDGNLATTSGMVSAAYHKGLDDFNKFHLSVGVQGGIVQKRIDFSELKFEEQYTGDGNFNTALSNQEQIESNSLLYPDFNIGILGQALFSKNLNAHLGFAQFHVFEPEESFLEDEENELESRSVVHGGVNVEIAETFGISPGFLYMQQSQANQVTFGSAFRYLINETTSGYLGLWHRWDDSIIPYAGFEMEGVRVGVSYDITVSDLSTAATNVGSVEISAVYIHNSQPPQRLDSEHYCPRF